jgi:hypothetical protein
LSFKSFTSVTLHMLSFAQRKPNLVRKA